MPLMPSVFVSHISFQVGFSHCATMKAVLLGRTHVCIVCLVGRQKAQNRPVLGNSHLMLELMSVNRVFSLICDPQQKDQTCVCDANHLGFWLHARISPS